MDRYSKSSEGIYQGSKIARNSFGSPPSSHSASTANHSTQTGNEHVRLHSNTTTTSSSSSNDSAHHNRNYAKIHRGTINPKNNDLRDELSMATKDRAVQQQLQNSQFYQRELHDTINTCSTGKKIKDVDDDDVDDAAAVATDEEDDINRRLDPNMYDNVQYS